MAAAVVPFPRCGASEKKPRVVPSPFERARVSQRSEGADQQHTTHKARIAVDAMVAASAAALP